jgi:Protein of unknown function (DUF3105)
MAKARKGQPPKRSGGRPGGGAAATPSFGLTRRQRRRLVVAAGVVAALVAVAMVGWLYARARGPLPGEFVASLGNDHIPTDETPHIPYNSEPPTSGPHLPYIAPWGVHVRPLPKELQVHNLEDGGVVINYKPQCADQVQSGLRAIVDRYPDHVVLAPYPTLDRCIALTAWTRIDKMDELDESRVVRFIEAYRGIDHHPQ